MTNDYGENHPRPPRQKPPSDADDRILTALLKERVGRLMESVGELQEQQDDLCDRMTKLEILKASGAKVSWFVATAITAIITSAASAAIVKLMTK